MSRWNDNAGGLVHTSGRYVIRGGKIYDNQTGAELLTLADLAALGVPSEILAVTDASAQAVAAAEIATAAGSTVAPFPLELYSGGSATGAHYLPNSGTWLVVVEVTGATYTVAVTTTGIGGSVSDLIGNNAGDSTQTGICNINGADYSIITGGTCTIEKSFAIRIG